MRAVRTHANVSRCSTDVSPYFLGNARAADKNVAGGGDSSVSSGRDNRACAYASGIVSGVDNWTLVDQFYDTGDHGFAGAGYYNTIDASYGAVGAGQLNFADNTTFVGAGFENYAYDGSFYGAGGSADFTADQSNELPNVAIFSDAFGGAGDANEVDGYQFSSSDPPGGPFLGSGYRNESGAGAAAVAGGLFNIAGGYGLGVYDVVLGGDFNINAPYTSGYAAISGGYSNEADGQYSLMEGGYDDGAGGEYAATLGGNTSGASGTDALAAGYEAYAGNGGSFVWSDDHAALTQDSAPNQFVVRASGGTKLFSNEADGNGALLAAGSGTWASVSDRNAKTGFDSVDGSQLVAKMSSLPIAEWSYRAEGGTRHVGPMAQDFYAAFGLGANDLRVTSIDESGVALVALKALSLHARHREAQIGVQRREISELWSDLRDIERDLRARRVRCTACTSMETHS